MNTKIAKSLLLLAHLCASCSSTENDTTFEEPMDTDPPAITVSEIGDTIEQATSLTISVNDDSNNVTTTIVINEDEVLSTTQKQISFDLDPFEYPSGETSITIRSVDQNNNISEKDYSLVIKKLLYRQNFGISSESIDSYIAINLVQTGELIAFKKLSSFEDSEFYALDGFEKQDLVITNYLISKFGSFHLGLSYAGVKPGTIRLNHNEIKAAFGLEGKVANKNDQLNLTIENASAFARFSTLGHFYSFGASNDPVLTIDYDQGNTTDIFIQHNTGDNANLLEDYRYLFVQDFDDRNIDFDELSRLGSEDVRTVSLPESVVDYVISLTGFNNETEYKEGYSRFLYSHFSQTNNTGFSFNYPHIKEYEILKKALTINLVDGRKILFERRDISDINIPEISIQQSDGDISINGEYDFSLIFLQPNNLDASSNAIFHRKYQSTYSDHISNPFESLEIPAEIVDILNTQGFNLSPQDSSGEMTLSLTQYESDIEYPDGVFYYRIGNETGDATMVTFPLNN